LLFTSVVTRTAVGVSITISTDGYVHLYLLVLAIVDRRLTIDRSTSKA
jgi:hypothetical protein